MSHEIRLSGTSLCLVTLAVLFPGAWGSCYDSTGQAMTYLASLPSTTPATIELCPHRVYTIGSQTANIDEPNDWASLLASFDGEPPLLARSNTYYKCGSSGSSHENCILLLGQVQFWSAAFFDEPVTNVLVQGITFETAQSVAILLEEEGDISFEDCVVKVRGYCMWNHQSSFLSYCQRTHSIIRTGAI